MVKGECRMWKLHTVPYNMNPPTYDLGVPYFDMRNIKEWLKFHHNLEAVIIGQTFTNAKGMYGITKSILRGDTLMAFKYAEGVNRPQTKPNYSKTVKK
eukprot:11545121-Ditylum_brightwellii.AAC.1